MPKLYGSPGTQGITSWGLTVDKDGQRTYSLKVLVLSDSNTQGPYAIYQYVQTQIPLGSSWQFPTAYDDIDVWAFAHWDWDVRPVTGDRESTQLWEVTIPFRTSPVTRCQITPVVNPLLEPQIIDGSFSKYTKEIVYDIYGNFISNSAFEQIRGQQVEFDFNRPQIVIEQIVANLDFDGLTTWVDSVNDAPLWGFPARCIKLSDVKVTRLVYGGNTVYWKRVLTFDTNIIEQDPITGEPASGFDRRILDEGNKALYGQWVNPGMGSPGLKWQVNNFPNGTTPSATNPLHFIRVQDPLGNPMHLILNGSGVPYDPSVMGSSPGSILIQGYPANNFLLLGIPSDLNSDCAYPGTGSDVF